MAVLKAPSSSVLSNSNLGGGRAQAFSLSPDQQHIIAIRDTDRRLECWHVGDRITPIGISLGPRSASRGFTAITTGYGPEREEVWVATADEVGVVEVVKWSTLLSDTPPSTEATKILREAEGHGRVEQLAISNGLLAAACEGIFVWELKGLSLVKRLESPSLTCFFSPLGPSKGIPSPLLASSGASGTMQLWNLEEASIGRSRRPPSPPQVNYSAPLDSIPLIPPLPVASSDNGGGGGGGEWKAKCLSCESSKAILERDIASKERELDAKSGMEEELRALRSQCEVCGEHDGINLTPEPKPKPNANPNPNLKPCLNVRLRRR